MIRFSAVHRESWRAHYHRVRVPRTLALSRFRDRVEMAQARTTAKEAGAAVVPAVPEKTYRYNRWWVGDKNEFIHQHHVIEDPEIVARRRASLPEPTASDLWKTPKKPFFEPLVPFVDIKDFPKDPDVKFLKPATVPRWKDFMMRKRPMVPRTWY